MKSLKFSVRTTGLLWLGLACVPAVAAGNRAGATVAVNEPVRGESGAPDESGATGAERHSGKLLQRTHPLIIQGGVLTVDGLTVRSGLNLRVPDLQYMYVYLPGTGTAVLAEHPFPGARQEPTAFQGRTLTVLVGVSRVQLTTANRMRTNRPVYVQFEPGELDGARMPAVSFGSAAMVPAVWSRGRVGARRHGKARAHRVLRAARLCRPSPEGKERCAIVREVVYEH